MEWGAVRGVESKETKKQTTRCLETPPSEERNNPLGVTGPPQPQPEVEKCSANTFLRFFFRTFKKPKNKNKKRLAQTPYNGLPAGF